MKTIDPHLAIDFMIRNAKAYAEAKAQVTYLEQYRKTKKAIRQAFENQKGKKGTSFVEVVSNCNSGWKMTAPKANEWMVENMFAKYPIGDIKVDGELVQK